MNVAGERYELPLGFAGFGIKIPARAAGLRIFEEWHVSYHGLSACQLVSVLREGGLLLPGDVLLDGSQVKAIHTLGGAESVQLYTSPSPKYAEQDVYTSPGWFGDELAKVVLQCRQQPGYGVSGETMGLTWQISSHFGNDVIERYTRARASIIPYRILVKLYLPAACQVIWSGRSLGTTAVTVRQVRKCHDEEYLLEGDVVAAACDLDFGAVGHLPDWQGAIVAAGSIGILKRQPGRTDRVAWIGRDLAETAVTKDQIRKCSAADYLCDGDIVKAAYDLDFGSVGHVGDDHGAVVRQGSQGVLRHSVQPMRVEWLGRELAETVVQRYQIHKCAPHEFIRVNDVVRATRDLPFDGRVVLEGSLGTVVHVSMETETCIICWSGHRPLGNTSVCLGDTANATLGSISVLVTLSRPCTS